MLDAPVGGAVQLRIFRSCLSAPAESPWVIRPIASMRYQRKPAGQSSQPLSRPRLPHHPPRY